MAEKQNGRVGAKTAGSTLRFSSFAPLALLSRLESDRKRDTEKVRREGETGKKAVLLFAVAAVVVDAAGIAGVASVDCFYSFLFFFCCATLFSFLFLSLIFLAFVSAAFANIHPATDVASLASSILLLSLSLVMSFPLCLAASFLLFLFSSSRPGFVLSVSIQRNIRAPRSIPSSFPSLFERCMHVAKATIHPTTIPVSSLPTSYSGLNTLYSRWHPLKCKLSPASERRHKEVAATPASCIGICL